jgi:hypothetical protein
VKRYADQSIEAQRKREGAPCEAWEALPRRQLRKAGRMSGCRQRGEKKRKKPERGERLVTA